VISFPKAGGPRVSFDIDDTLVCGAHVPTEAFVSAWRRRRYPEPVRRGTTQLLRALSRRGFRLWVYTTSRRPVTYLDGWFRSAGIRLDGVVNLDVHEEVVGRQGPSKFPPAFGIDLHVDDAEGVAIEGRQHGFRVLHVQPDDPSWAEQVMSAAQALPARTDNRLWTRPHRVPLTGAHFALPGQLR